MIERRYRSDYPGEFVVLNTDIRRGIKEQKREWIENTLEYRPTTPCAAVIGGNHERDNFDYRRIARHHGGLYKHRKLRTYGTGPIWREMRLDVYCGTDRRELDQLQQSGYQADTTVFSTARYCMLFPGQFYLIPFQPPVNDLAAAVYLAAFDGYKEIYLIGYSMSTPGNTRNWQNDVLEIMRVYNTHQFTLVGGPSDMPDAWRELDNVECLTYRNFRFLVDI